MKAMRDILIVLGLVSVLSVSAQTLAQQPSNDFRSTSAMVGSGSAYSANPSLNADGTVAYEGANYTPAQVPGSGPRKIGGQTIEGSPLGDAVWPLLLMATTTCGVIALRKRKNAQSKA